MYQQCSSPHCGHLQRVRPRSERAVNPHFRLLAAGVGVAAETFVGSTALLADDVPRMTPKVCEERMTADMCVG